MTVVALAIFIVPFWFAIGALIDAPPQGIELVRTYLTTGLGPPPDWLERCSLDRRAKIAEKWRELAAGGPEWLVATVRPITTRSAAYLAVRSPVASGRSFLHFVLTVIIAAILYSQGEVASQGVLNSRGDSDMNAAKKRASSPGRPFVAWRLASS